MEFGLISCASRVPPLCRIFIAMKLFGLFGVPRVYYRAQLLYGLDDEKSFLEASSIGHPSPVHCWISAFGVERWMVGV
jgi:hypothetical protein